MMASIYATRSLQASPRPTILNCLLSTWFAAIDGSPALTGHCLVDMMPQSDLPSVEEQFVASGRQVLPLVGVAALEPGDIFGIAPALRLRVPLDVLQLGKRAPNPPSGLSEVSPVSAVTASDLAVQPRPLLWIIWVPTCRLVMSYRI